MTLAKENMATVHFLGTPIAIFTPGLHGHRKSYLDLAIKLFCGRRVNKWQAYVSKAPVLYLMIEDNFVLYVITGVVRAIFKRRTVGLLFRPLPALNGTTQRLRSKRWILKVLKEIKLINTVSIVPFLCAPAIDTICDNWIYDPQLWDLSKSDRDEYQSHRTGSKISETNKLLSDATKLEKQIRIAGHGRKILISLGAQSQDKGINVLTSVAGTHTLEKWLITAAGRFDESASELRSTLEKCGHLVVDRYLSDAEIIAAYATADATWCLYHAKYDQASGILGRSIQFGIPPIVRRGSIGHILCKKDNIPHICADGATDLEVALASVPDRFEEFALKMTQRYRDHSVKVLKSALAVESIEQE